MSNVRIGVYVCHCGSNIAGKVDVKAVAEFARGLPGVVVARDYIFMCSEPGQELIQNDIREQRLNRVVVASCSPLMHEGTFRKACSRVGLNHYLMQMANLREQCSWVTLDGEAATEKAKALVAGAVGKTRFLQPLNEREVSVKQAVLVVGGGIAGIQAALQCADAGYKVYLVERKQSIGGHMAMFDKTFPTLDCSACILTPKMVSVGQHPNIELMAYSEVEEVGGYVGNLRVKVRHKAAYVDHDKCNGCGVCLEKCPARVPNEFEQGRGQRRAIYTMFPQAVPNKPVIDADVCRFFTKGKCGVCEKFCKNGAIDLKQQDRISEVEVGAVILATGHQVFDAEKMPRYGYGKYPDVYSALDFERMVNAGGFSGGEVRCADGRQPEAVGLVHCVGSRDQNHLRYCSQVCCMYSLKFAHLIKEHTGAQVYNFYIDMRCVGKGYEEFYDRLLEEGVRFVRGKVAEVSMHAKHPSEEGKLIVQVEDTLAGVVRRIPLDMLVLANGLQSRDDADSVGRLFGVSRNQNGFFIEQHPKLNPIGTPNHCVFIAGTCAGPKDIPHAVAQASAAAAGAMTVLRQESVLLESIAARVREEVCSGCRTCLDVCPYDAVRFDEEAGRASIDETMCRGCGTCVASCPSAAIEGRHFTDDQIESEIEGLLMSFADWRPKEKEEDQASESASVVT
ncbi:MAG: CoB--CoM heterodisulfide reductase iron-sulfur subunit A family protein [Deltaproteobacteria bacterium]|nr:CoB--CoM heterodisulfide reductase iron-sulfur subunit A family protein [Deltaproteobacteria bacterium]